MHSTDLHRTIPLPFRLLYKITSSVKTIAYMLDVQNEGKDINIGSCGSDTHNCLSLLYIQAQKKKN